MNHNHWILKDVKSAESLLDNIIIIQTDIFSFKLPCANSSYKTKHYQLASTRQY